MINTIIAYDDNDSDLGDYFFDSHSDINAVVEGIDNINNVSIRGLDCTELFVGEVILSINANRFIFIALSHGNENALVSHEVYVSTSNVTAFSNSLFYSCACSTGYQLGNDLIHAGCLTFVGYSDTVYVINDYYQVFFTCQNHGIKQFLSNDETIDVSYNKMIDNYNIEIDRLIIGTIDDVIAASSLLGNRDCLIILGSRTLRSSDFHIL